MSIYDYLFVTQSNKSVNYIKNVTQTIPDITFYVSSSLQGFYLDALPTSSLLGIKFYNDSQLELSETNRLRLSPTNTLVPIIVKIDTTNFNTTTLSNLSFDIKFNLIQTPIPDSSSTNDGNTGVGSTVGGGGITGNTFNTNTGTVDTTIPDRDVTQL